MLTLPMLLLLMAWTTGIAAQDAATPQTIDTVDGPVTVQSNVPVMMRDGTSLSVDIYRPAEAGSYPTLYAAAPYPHHGDATPPDTPETGPVAWFVNRGYNYVLASVRGSGRSQGLYRFLDRQEQQDHYELIQWIAAQSWSDGRVAGIGAGYYATAQWQMAVQSPPALACIAPYNGVVRPYQDWAFPGGLASSAFIQNWYEGRVRENNAFPASGPQRLIEYDLRLQQLMHTEYDDYWRERSSFEYLGDITVPVFMLRDWNRSEPGINGTFAALRHLRSNNKLLLPLNPEGGSLYRDRALLENELMPFYDWCLRDPDLTRFIERPRIRYHVRGERQLRPESRWPPGNATFTPVFLALEGDTTTARDGMLTFEQDSGGARSSAFGEGTGVETLRFVSAPLEQDLIIAGPVMMELFAGSSSTDTGFRITLSEEVTFEPLVPVATLPDLLQPPAGEDRSDDERETISVNVTGGSLKASDRVIDEQRSQPNDPFLLFDDPRPLSPERVTRFRIPLDTTAYRFRAGNRMVITVSQTVDGSLQTLAGRDRIYQGDNYPSALWLPVTRTVSRSSRTPRQTPELPAFDASSDPDLDFLNADGLGDPEANPVILVNPEESE